VKDDICKKRKGKKKFQWKKNRKEMRKNGKQLKKRAKNLTIF
jgi:hypothetical protein